MSHYQIVQIWLENPNPPDETTLGYMRGVITSMPEGSSYTLIANSNYLEAEGAVFVDINNVIADARLRYSDIDIIWDYLPVTAKSDILRLFWASKSGKQHTFYLDSDVEVVSWPEYTSYKYPYLAKIGQKNVDTFIFYLASNSVYAQVMLNLIVDAMKRFLELASYQTTIPISLPYSVININEPKHRVARIGNGYFIHHSLRVSS